MMRRRRYLLFSLFLLTLWLLSGINSVYAQENTPEWQPLYQTPTPYNINTTCPGYQPSGYGQITPNPVWLNYCSHCITPVSNYPWATFEWGDNPNPPYETPTPNPTATTTGSIDGFTFWTNGGFQYQYNQEYYKTWSLGQYLLQDDNYVDNTALIYSNGADNGQVYNMSFEYRLKGNMPSWSIFDWMMGIRLQITNTSVYLIEVEVVEGINAGTEYQLLYNQAANIVLKTWNIKTGGSLDESGVINLTVHGGTKSSFADIKIDFESYTSVTGWGGTAVFERWLTWHRQHYELGPDPTPTPHADYCGIINGDGSGPGEDEDGELPVITIGAAQCVNIGGFEIPLEWITNFFDVSVTNWTVPGLSLCFTPINFGQLNIFGIEIDLDFLAMMLAAIALYVLLKA